MRPLDPLGVQELGSSVMDAVNEASPGVWCVGMDAFKTVQLIYPKSLSEMGKGTPKMSTTAHLLCPPATS